MNLFSNKKKLTTISIGIVIGMIGGFAYWKFIGCQSGTCPLTSNWHTSVMFGGVFGYLISDSFKSEKKKVTEKTEQQE